MDKTTSCVIYWLTDSRCVCPWRHGYIGISTRYSIRLRQHKRKWPTTFKAQILFAGTLSECRALEFKFRPHANIGWNENPGGGKTAGKKISAALKGRSIKWGDKIARTLMGHVRTTESRTKQSASTKGRAKSPKWKASARTAAIRRYAKPGEKERTAAAVKKAVQGINRWQRHYRKHGQLDFDL
jgi:hypothetical protein